MNKLFKESQSVAMSLRMIPLKSTFQKMTRIVRDISNATKKEINFVIKGKETEIDKTVLEKMSDPLVHIIRNSVDHGIELPDDRIAAGKEKVGYVELSAFHEGSQLIIEVTDDGKGIDPNIIRKKAIQKKIITQDQNISDQEITNLIFHPGFSTKEQVTEISGRGVGMDVVKTNIELLGGEVDLTSKVGQGSLFRISLPLTLAIIEGIIILVGHDKYVIPLSQIFEIIQLKKNEIKKFSGVAQLFRLRGEVMPLFHINKKLGYAIKKDESFYTVIIVRNFTYAFGVIVEDIIHQQQIVIKKIGEDIVNTKGIIGSAIMSDGLPALILDFVDFFRNDIKKSQSHQKYQKRTNNTA